MLVLSRKPGDCIRIDHHIRISIVQISARRVRIGIEAPVEIPIHREEIWNSPDDSHVVPKVSNDQTPSQETSFEITPPTQ